MQIPIPIVFVIVVFKVVELIWLNIMSDRIRALSERVRRLQRERRGGGVR